MFDGVNSLCPGFECLLHTLLSLALPPFLTALFVLLCAFVLACPGALGFDYQQQFAAVQW